MNSTQNQVFIEIQAGQAISGFGTPMFQIALQLKR
jgi:hypothetical protein